ncbi:MAG TPA: FtsH protease activity modulator HflK [Casimicrobiaceae bacterium]|jgi:membrane protease subunit HflK|nr:FtsH protease activity modulator HflK [Casimicrobiaceae bacterium]
MSLNDPQWGKRGGNSGGGGGGPPDLDEIWRNVNRRLADMLGRRGGPELPPGEPRPPRAGLPLSGVGLLVALVLVVWLASGFYIVDEGRRGVVMRFGKYVETTQPGPRWHVPFPVESVELVDFSQVKTIEIGYRNSPKNKVDREAVMITDDENIIDILFAVQYNIKNAEDYVFQNRKPDVIVAWAAESAIREVTAKVNMDFVLYEGREQIARQTEALLQDMLDRFKTGAFIQKVTLQNVVPPEKVQAAFDDAVKAGQDRERLKNEGQAYANDVIPRARGNAARLLEEAQGYQTAVVSKAEGDASRFRQIVAEYQKAPGVTRDRLYLDMMQSVLGPTSKVLVEPRSGNLLYLPLDRLIQQSGAPPGPASAADAAAAATRTTPPVDAPAAIDPQRSRDALRRERGG